MTNIMREEAINLGFKFAPGELGGRFLAALRGDRRILAARCPGCELVVCPARSLCPRCGGALSEQLVAAGPGGELLSWTEVPGTGFFGLVRLDGADTAILHRLVPLPGSVVRGFPTERSSNNRAVGGSRAGWEIGLRVTARFAQDRHGSILDIEGFEPEAFEPDGSAS